MNKDQSKFTKMEKADVLELTVNYLKTLDAKEQPLNGKMMIMMIFLLIENTNSLHKLFRQSVRGLGFYCPLQFYLVAQFFFWNI